MPKVSEDASDSHACMASGCRAAEDGRTPAWMSLGVSLTKLVAPAVDPKTAVKSMLSSKNFRPYIDKYGEVVSVSSLSRLPRASELIGGGDVAHAPTQMHWMGILATELHLRLNDAREETPGLWVSGPLALLVLPACIHELNARTHNLPSRRRSLSRTAPRPS